MVYRGLPISNSPVHGGMDNFKPVSFHYSNYCGTSHGRNKILSTDPTDACTLKSFKTVCVDTLSTMGTSLCTEPHWTLFLWIAPTPCTGAASACSIDRRRNEIPTLSTRGRRADVHNTLSLHDSSAQIRSHSTDPVYVKPQMAVERK